MYTDPRQIQQKQVSNCGQSSIFAIPLVRIIRDSCSRYTTNGSNAIVTFLTICLILPIKYLQIIITSHNKNNPSQTQNPKNNMKQIDYEQDEQQILHEEQSQIQKHQHNSNNVPKIYVVMVVIASILFVGSLGLNVYVRMGGLHGVASDGWYDGLGLDDVQYEQVLDYMRSDVRNVSDSVDGNNDLSPIPVNTTQRLTWGAPTPLLPKMRILTISKRNPSSTTNTCLLTNGIDIISNTSIQTATTLLAQSAYRKWVVILDRHDKYSDGLWMHFVQNAGRMGTVYDVVEKNVTVDADYQFIINAVSGCRQVVYVQHYFKITAEQSNKLTTTISKTINQQYLLFTTAVHTNNKKQQLPNLNLNTTKLSDISSKQLNKYVFVFTVEFLHIITPFNYAYYARYTIQEIIIRPILTILWGSTAMMEINHVVHEFDVAFGSSKEFVVQQAGKTGKGSRNSGKSPTCFVSYPLIPDQINYQQLQQYFNSLTNITGIENSTLIINIPHISPLLYKTYTLIMPYSQKYHIRLRITTNKTTSSLAVYEAAYCYCPQHAILISSRHNVVFYVDFLKELLASLQVKYHYYFAAHQIHDENGQNTVVNMTVPFRYYKRQFREQLTNYQSHFMQLQIFKADLFRMMYFWSLKCDEVDFYQTQASFVIPLLQMVRLIMGIITKPTYKVIKRVITTVEREQMNNLKLYYQWSPIPYNKLYPIPYNSLENVAYKRNPRDKIPKIIHQVWLGNKEITPFQLKLQQSLIQVNKDFKVLLWRDQNITAEMFPFTYALIHRILQYQQFTNRSYLAPTVSLIRYQLLYTMGGIYIDFKTQGKKPLNPFLKYEIFFIDIDYGPDHYIFHSNVGNGIMGARRNNYHLLLTLTELITEEKFNFKAFDFPRIVGGYVLRKSLTTYEMFTQVGYGFQFFSQKPGTGKPNLCSLSEGLIDPDQQSFKVADFLTGKMFTIVLPCKHYKQAYLIMYKVLAGTWKTKKIFQPGNAFLSNLKKNQKTSLKK